MNDVPRRLNLFDVTTMPVGVLQCNCSIISCRKTREAIIVDPGGDADRIIAQVEEGGFKVTHLLHTHAHLDHFAATGEVHHHTGGCIALHKEDMFLYEQAPMQSMMLGLPPVSPPDITHHIEDEEEYVFGENKMKAIYTPGHTPGSASFLIDDGTNQLLFSGDTLFRRGIGRTDLPGGDSHKIVKSIKNRLYTLDGETKVIPGHGPLSTIGEERFENPFVRR